MFYDSNGYVDIRAIMKTCPVPYIFIVGGRGTGKTYTALKTMREDGKRIMLMRRTQKQIDVISKDVMSPYKPLAVDEGFLYHTEAIAKDVACVYEDFDDGRKKPLGYMTALSTISNLRGFDASDVDVLIYDEFIPERHERPIKNEAEAFFNAYETLNRNRELKGQKPIQCLFLANANDLANPLFAALELTAKAERMKQRKQTYTVDPDRGYAIVLLTDSPISEKKALTALYKLTRNGRYNEMALNNIFAYNDLTNVRSEILSGYEPIVKVGDIYIYKHKSKKLYYATRHGSGEPPEYSSTPTGLMHFYSKFGHLKYNVVVGSMLFENYEIKDLVMKYLHLGY